MSESLQWWMAEAHRQGHLVDGLVAEAEHIAAQRDALQRQIEDSESLRSRIEALPVYTDPEDPLHGRVVRLADLRAALSGEL